MAGIKNNIPKANQYTYIVMLENRLLESFFSLNKA